MADVPGDVIERDTVLGFDLPLVWGRRR